MENHIGERSRVIRKTLIAVLLLTSAVFTSVVPLFARADHEGTPHTQEDTEQSIFDEFGEAGLTAFATCAGNDISAYIPPTPKFFECQAAAAAASGAVVVGGITGQDVDGAQVGQQFGKGLEGLLGDALGRLTLEAVSIVIWFVTQVLVWITLFILSIVGAFLNFIVNEFVIGMGRYITAENAIAVREGWTIIRDLANIAIIGGLVATAIGTIIQAKSYGVSQNLARLILAALLVNFSYFVAGAIIDVSNFTARAAYESLICNPAQGETAENCGIASKIAEVVDFDQISAFGLAASSFINPVAGVATGAVLQGDVASQLLETVTPSRNATYNVMLLIFICVTTFVFLSVIALLVGRFVVLIFLLITSPIGIAGMGVPFLKHYSEEWWKALTNQAMFAPVFLILAGIALGILEEFKNALLFIGRSGEAGTYFQAGLNDALRGMVGVVAMFTVAIGFIWAALSVAKKMSAEGAERFQDIYKATGAAFGWMPKAYRGLVMAVPKTAAFGAGVLLRDTIGRRAHDYAIKYRKWAEQNRPDQKGPVSSALDRALKEQLDRVAGQQFFGAKGYHDLHEAKKARRADLGRGELEQELRGKAEGKLAKADQEELEKLEAQKNKGLTEAEEKELARLEAIDKDKLTKDEIATIKDLQERRRNQGITDEERKFLEDAKAGRIKLNDEGRVRLANIEGRLKRGGLDEEQEARYDDLQYANTPGGILKRYADAQAKATALRKDGEYRNINEEEEYAKLSAERARIEAIPEADRSAVDKAKLEEFYYYEQKARDKERLMALKAERDSGAWKDREDKETLKKVAELGVLEARNAVGDLDLQKNARESANHAHYWRRQAEKGIDGRKREESLVGYYERVEKKDADQGGSGLRTALAKLQALDAQMPAGFIDRLYDEFEHHPDELIKWAPMLRPEDYEKLMKDDKFPRDIKDKMRIARHGEWIDMNKELDRKVKQGEVLEGSDEFKELQAVAYRYSMKRFKDPREFNDIITSRVGEPLRKMRSMWNGGSLTSMFQNSRDLFGQYEARDIAALKREAYYKHQRALAGARALTGLEPVWEKDANGAWQLKDGYFAPNKIDSDNFSAIKEAWSDARDKLASAEQILASETASTAAKMEAMDNKRFYSEVLELEKNPEYKSAFGKIADENARIKEVYEYNQKAKDLWAKVDSGEFTEAEAAALARNDDKLFITYHQQKHERGMYGFTAGKSDDEMDMVSPERTFDPATVIGKSASTLAHMMTAGKGYDNRWRTAIRRSFLIEKTDSEIQDLVLNFEHMKAFGGWPEPAAIDEINRYRRIKNGLPPDKEAPGIDLPYQAQAFRGVTEKAAERAGEEAEDEGAE